MLELGVGKSNAKNILNMIDVIKRTSNTWGQHETESVENLAKRLEISTSTVYCISTELITIVITSRISLSDIEEMLRHMIQEHTHPSRKPETPQELSDRLGLPMDAIDYIAFGIWRILYGLLSNSGCGVWEPNLDAFTNRDKG